MNKKVAAGVAVTVMAASVATNVAFEPQELIHSADHLASHTEYAETVQEGDTRVLASYSEAEHISLADAARGWFIRLPVAVKAVFLLPLWALGALPVAIGTALAPVWVQVLGFALQAGVLIGVFCLVYKLIFPKRKVRELFKKKNFKWLFMGAVTVTAANMLLAQVWTGWPVARLVLTAAAGFGVLCLLWKRLCGKFKAPKPQTVETRLVLEY